ncbi:MAG: hypothetical protein ACLFR0_06020 [Alphaproteobacteria bacterium]
MPKLQKCDHDYMRKAFDAYRRYEEIHVGLSALDMVKEHRELNDAEIQLGYDLRKEKEELEQNVGLDVLSP